MIRVRPAAQQDLESIAHYLEEQSLSAGLPLRFYAEFAEACGLYEQFPLMGKLSGYHSAGGEGIRMFILRRFGKYVVFYRPQQDGLLIVRVLDGARHIPFVMDADTRD